MTLAQADQIVGMGMIRPPQVFRNLERVESKPIFLNKAPIDFPSIRKKSRLS